MINATLEIIFWTPTYGAALITTILNIEIQKVLSRSRAKLDRAGQNLHFTQPRSLAAYGRQTARPCGGHVCWLLTVGGLRPPPASRWGLFIGNTDARDANVFIAAIMYP